MLNRGTGRTTEQMKSAPKGATFVWCNGHLGYPRALAAALGRHDLRIVSPSALASGSLRGLSAGSVICDHWLDPSALSRDEERGYRELQIRASRAA